MERWTGTPEGTCNVLRMFRETHAISARSSSTTRIREKARRNEPLDRSNAKDLVQVVRILREVDVVSAFSSSTTRIRDRTQLLGRKTEDKKNLTV